jgi:uncharacterized protein (TIGR03086 family)
MPGPALAAVAVDEVVVHGWDLAVATDQRLVVDETSLAIASGFVEALSAPEQAEVRAGIFGPVVPVPEDASPLDRLLGGTGRDPAWRSSRATTR